MHIGGGATISHWPITSLPRKALREQASQTPVQAQGCIQPNPEAYNASKPSNARHKHTHTHARARFKDVPGQSTKGRIHRCKHLHGAIQQANATLTKQKPKNVHGHSPSGRDRFAARLGHRAPRHGKAETVHAQMLHRSAALHIREATEMNLLD